MTCLNLKNMERCNIDLLLADDSAKHTLYRVNNAMVELLMTFCHVDFIVMDMGSKTSRHIILGRPFLRMVGLSLTKMKGM